MWEDVNGPGDVYCSPEGLVYVAEQGGSLGKGPAPIGVSIFTEEGELVGRLRGFETGLTMPHGIWCDSKGNVFVAELGTDGNKARKLAKV